VLDRHDPLGVVEISPSEYDAEADHFARLIRQHRVITPSLVGVVWEHWLGGLDPT
jgi:hypothetical protein